MPFTDRTDGPTFSDRENATWNTSAGSASILTAIEEGVVARLTEKITAPKNVAIDEAHSDVTLALPGIEVIIGGGLFARLAQKYKITCSVFVIITFRNMQSVKDRRHGVYPILEAIMACLILQTFQLRIDALTPKRLDNITEADEAKKGQIVFQLEFETGFTIEKMSDEVLADLLSIGLNYYLTPGDDVVDASDVVTLGT